MLVEPMDKFWNDSNSVLPRLINQNKENWVDLDFLFLQRTCVLCLCRLGGTLMELACYTFYEDDCIFLLLQGSFLKKGES